MKNLRRYSTERTERPRMFLLLIGIMLLAAVMSLCIGAVPVAPKDVLSAIVSGKADTVAARIILYTRLPRTLAALLAGGALAVSGAVLQTVLCNPLAAPNIIGVNSSAGLAVAVACAVAPMSAAATPLIAFIGALIGVLLVLGLSEMTGASRMTVVLSGVAVSNLFAAAIDAVVTFVPDALNGYSDFKIGGFSDVTMAKIVPAGGGILISLMLILTLSQQMDVLALGPETAQSLGLSVRPIRLLLLVLAAALCGAAISFSGLLGFGVLLLEIPGVVPDVEDVVLNKNLFVKGSLNLRKVAVAVQEFVVSNIFGKIDFENKNVVISAKSRLENSSIDISGKITDDIADFHVSSDKLDLRDILYKSAFKGVADGNIINFDCKYMRKADVGE